MYVYAQRTFHLPYSAPRLALALAVLAGAVAVTQIGWPDAVRHLVFLVALIGSFALLLALGGREMVRSLRAVSHGKANPLAGSSTSQ